jgi:RHS repeat-associated protein
LLADGHGSTRQLVAGTSAISVNERYNYDGYGQTLGTTYTPSTPPLTKLLYTGQQFDVNMQQYYLRARYYDPSNGRFNQLDTFVGHNEDPQSLHKYAYANCDPANVIDPSGEFGLVEVLVVTAIIAILATVTGCGDKPKQAANQVKVRTIPISSKQFWSAYEQVNYKTFPPTNSLGFWKFLGGGLGKWGGTPPDDPQNSCATRLSWGLNHSNNKIPSEATESWWFNDSHVSYAGKIGDDYYYIVAARKMNQYLYDTYGPPVFQPKTAADVDKIESLLNEEQVAVFATSKPGEGHAGALKNGYKDPYVRKPYELDKGIQVWFLSP